MLEHGNAATKWGWPFSFETGLAPRSGFTPVEHPKHEATQRREDVKKKRIRLLEAISRAQEAAAEAMVLAMTLDDEDEELTLEDLALSKGPHVSEPPNVVRETDKTGPRLPFKTNPPVSTKSTVQSTYAFTAERALRHVRKAYHEATTDDERNKVVALMLKLVKQNLIERDDIAIYLPTEKREPSK